MASTEDGIKTLLVAAGVGVFAATTGWSIQIGRIIDEPDTQIVIFATGGKPSEPKLAIDYPSVQVLVRGSANGYEAARQKIIDVKNALLGLPSQTVNGDRWDSVLAIGDIKGMGYDQKQRPSFVMNFSLIIEPATTGYRQ